MRVIPHSICPQVALQVPDVAASEVLKAIIVRSNFIPGIRFQLGWRGVKDCCFASDAWTMKLAGYSGVFGIRRATVMEQGGVSVGVFPVSYFPQPDEDIVESFSVQAGLITQLNEYKTLLREYVKHEALCDAFTIGAVHVAVLPDGTGFTLGLESSSRLASVAVDGVVAGEGTELAEVIAAGDFDQNIPAWDMAYDFFRVLAASTSYCMQHQPGRMMQRIREGRMVHYTAKGACYAVPDTDELERQLVLEYGTIPNSANVVLYDASWTDSWQNIWCHDEPIPEEYSGEAWWQSLPDSQSKSLDKKVLGIVDKPRLIILTGFLGSGKTSFLREFIEYQIARNQFVAVVQNEIGKQGLDGKILGQEYAVTEVDEGCVCCSLVGSLKAAAIELTQVFQPDYIVVETTGLANPANLLSEIAELEDLIVFDSVTTVFDAEAGVRCLKSFEVARSQAAMADTILLNKVDLVTQEQLVDLHEEIRRMNPRASVLETVHGDVHPSALESDVPRNVREKRMPLLLTDLRNHTHDNMSSISIKLPKEIKREAFEAWIQALPEKVYRVKGALTFAGDENPSVVQYVAGRYDITPHPSDAMSDFLIAIGQKISESEIQFVV
jgi:G3E family GTPase